MKVIQVIGLLVTLAWSQCSFAVNDHPPGYPDNTEWKTPEVNEFDAYRCYHSGRSLRLQDVP